MATEPSRSNSKTSTTQSSASSSNYQVHHLPHPCPDLLVGQFLSLRLRAHSLSPTSFASTFAQEASRTPAQWSHLLSRPHFHVFVVVLHPSSSSSSSSSSSPLTSPLSPSTQPPSTTGNASHEDRNHQTQGPYPYLPSQGHVVGHISLLGPLPKSTYDVPEAQCPHASEPDEIESKWHMTALWTDPLHRGQGLATRLVKAAMAFACNNDGSVPPEASPQDAHPRIEKPVAVGAGTGLVKVKQARIRINTSGARDIVSMYRHWSFQDAGRACLAVAIRENGDEDFLPDDVSKGDGGDTQKWWNWYGTSLDRVVGRGEIAREEDGAIIP